MRSVMTINISQQLYQVLYDFAFLAASSRQDLLSGLVVLHTCLVHSRSSTMLCISGNCIEIDHTYM